MRIPMSALNRWHPEQAHKVGYLPGKNIMPHLQETKYSTRIQVGSILAWVDRKAYRVVEIQEFPVDLWPEQFCNEWSRYTEWWVQQIVAGRDMGDQPEKDSWENRPLRIVIRPADQPAAQEQHYGIRAAKPFHVLPEHYSVCRLCNEIPPCTHVTNEATVEYEMGKAARVMDIPPGHCLDCGEAITPRMKMVCFPGPNLWRPDLGNGSAVFHGRQQCADGVSAYRRQWKAQGFEDGQATLPFPV